MTATTKLEQDNTNKDSKHSEVDMEEFSDQTPMDDFSDAVSALPSSQYPGNTCRPLEQTPSASNIAENTAFRDHMMRLMQAEQEDKKKLLAARRQWADGQEDDSRATHRVLHRFAGSHNVFFEAPGWKRQEDAYRHYILQFGSEGVKVDEYLESNSHIVFVIFKNYAREAPNGLSTRTVRMAKKKHLLLPESESLLFVSEDMIAAVQAYLDSQPSFHKLFPDFDATAEIHTPYLFWFTFRAAYPSTLKRLSTPHRRLMKVFAKWISDNHGEEYAHVDDELLRGRIANGTMKFLIKPGDTLVSEEYGRYQAYLATSWAKEVNTTKVQSRSTPGIAARRWEVSAWSHEVDGTFYEKDTILVFDLEFQDPEDKVDLRGLSLVPIQYTDIETSFQLQERGKDYWRCRERRLVSYRDNVGTEYVASGERFIIDLETYKLLHTSEQNVTEPNTKRKSISPLALWFDEPPSAPEIYLFPPTVPGYSLGSKRWIHLDVDKICWVQWNKKSFENLVIDEDSKELLQAATTSQFIPMITDIMQGKEASVAILLHGPAGTGKTYTAETLSELVEKPLYRLSCADLGTELQRAEECLKSALYLGKTWDCIILLDDIDIFLEENTSSNIEQNAIVAAILRALDTYGGIIILTARYISKLNEAFRSRIRLAVHCPHPTSLQRQRIWRNLINNIKEFDQHHIEFEDIESQMNVLAEINMTGRQIRNTITMARQLANLRRKKMTYAELAHMEYSRFLFYDDSRASTSAIDRAT
ncbi:P-loop containing nucleoside triphosphate hydrolase protein [Aspergillus heterothallicus]